jgi:hypothetical protein
MTDRDMLAALLIGGVSVVLGAVNLAAEFREVEESAITFVTVFAVGWTSYKLNNRKP